MHFTDNAGPDQPAHKCRLIRAFVVLTESVDIVVYVNEQRMPRLAYTDGHADLNLHCLQIA